MVYENILVQQEDQLVHLHINRPTKLNALNKATIKELHDALRELQDNDSVKAILLRGSGDKAFVAGADISEFAHFSAAEGAQLAAEGQELLFDFIENYPKPILAAVNGFALGGGLELAMACHFRVASTNAKMGLPEVTLGVIPGYGGTQRLAQLVGKGKAMELVLTANMVTAEEALRLGLVNHVVPQEELVAFCVTLATKIAQNAPLAVSKAIQAINANFKDGVDGYQTEIALFGACFATQDFKEGTLAFLEKRKAMFKGN